MAAKKRRPAPTPADAPKSPSQMKLVIVGALALFVALVGAQVAVPLLNGMIAGGPHARRAADGGGRRRGSSSSPTKTPPRTRKPRRKSRSPRALRAARSAVRRELRPGGR